MPKTASNTEGRRAQHCRVSVLADEASAVSDAEAAIAKALQVGGNHDGPKRSMDPRQQAGRTCLETNSLSG